MKKWYLAVFAAALFAIPTASFANVFASDLHAEATSWNFGTDGSTISLFYRLNADSTSVTIKIFPAGSPASPVKTIVSTAAADVSAGVHEYLWDGTDDSSSPVADGNYSFSVTAAHTGFAAWTNITDGSTAAYTYDQGSNNYCVQWVNLADVQCVIDESQPQFGRVFISTSVGGPLGSIATMPAGVYMLNSDMSCYNPTDPYGSVGDATSAYCEFNSALPYAWTQEGTSALPDAAGMHMSRRNDGTPGMVIANGGGTTSKNLQCIYTFDYNGSAASLKSPLNYATNSSCLDPRRAFLTGTGVDRKLYVSDWDYLGPGQRGQVAYGVNKPVIWCYAIGETENNFSATPSLALNASGLAGNNSGGVWRGGDFIPGTTDMMLLGGETVSAAASRVGVLCQLWPDSALTAGAESQVVWQVTRDQWITDTGYNGGTPVTLYNSGLGNRMNEDDTLAFVGSPVGNYGIYNVATGAFTGGKLSTTNSLPCAGDSDAAGNLLDGGVYQDRLEVWSPPGANEMTTSWAAQGTGGRVAIANAASVDAWNLY